MDKQVALDELKRREKIAQALGGEKRIAKHRQRGHLTARERLDKLLDAKSWNEMGAFEQFTTDEGEESHTIVLSTFAENVSYTQSRRILGARSLARMVVR